MSKTLASFKIEIPYSSSDARVKTFTGFLTDTNGKISISGLGDSYSASPAMRSRAKTSLLKSWETRDESIFKILSETNDDLVNQLKEATKELKEVYLEKCKDSAKRAYEYNEKVASLNILEVALENYGVDLRVLKSISRIEDKAIREKVFAENGRILRARDFTSISFEKYLENEIKAANEHYESSVYKLAGRVQAKGLEKELTITGGRLGLNFEVTITDGVKTVRAWTIIAEGEIQRPHYRYLVK